MFQFMLVNAPLPDGDTGVMCDSTGHNGFGPFDNTLVLWGGGNPGPSCEENSQHKISFLRRTTLRNLQRQEIKEKKKVTNKFLEKLISVEMTCC